MRTTPDIELAAARWAFARLHNLSERELEILWNMKNTQGRADGCPVQVVADALTDILRKILGEADFTVFVLNYEQCNGTQ